MGGRNLHTMIDGVIRRYADPGLSRLGRWVISLGFTADWLSLAGFIIGMACVPLLAFQYYGLALMFLALNRLLDGLDGAVARLSQPTDQGAFLDIVLDFVFYSAFVFGVILSMPDQALAGAFLLFSFVANGSSFLAFAIFAEKLSISTSLRGEKSFYYLGGLAEGFETIVTFTLICLFPGGFEIFAVIFGIMCLVNAAYRIYIGSRMIARNKPANSTQTEDQDSITRLP